MMIKEDGLESKNPETCEEVIRQTLCIDLYIGYLFSDYILANLKLTWLIFYGLKRTHSLWI
jgi:hypothetical protein